MTVGPDNAFVNFISLAESVALAPMVGFWDSLEVSSPLEVDVLDLLPVELVLGVLLLWISSFIDEQINGLKQTKSPMSKALVWYFYNSLGNHRPIANKKNYRKCQKSLKHISQNAILFHRFCIHFSRIAMHFYPYSCLHSFSINKPNYMHVITY